MKSERKRETHILLSRLGCTEVYFSPSLGPLPEPTAPHCGRHCAPAALRAPPPPLSPGRSPHLAILSVLSIIYGLQGTITINNAQAIAFYSSHTIVLLLMYAGLGPGPSCSPFLPQQDPAWPKRRAGLARVGGRL